MLLLLSFLGPDDGPVLPENPGSAVVWVVFLGIVGALWFVVSRTRRRAEEEYWERKRQEERDERDRPDLE